MNELFIGFCYYKILAGIFLNYDSGRHADVFCFDCCEVNFSYFYFRTYSKAVMFIQHGSNIIRAAVTVAK